MFGTDAFPPDAASYRLAFRLCETDDEAFGYTPGHSGSNGEIPPQGRWDISAAGLLDLYAGNARRILAVGSFAG